MEHWTPSSILHRELENVHNRTTNALKALLKSHVPNRANEAKPKETQPSAGLEEKRAVMAREHNALVEALAEALGRDEAVRLGREAMFRVGEELGSETRRRLGVGDNPQDVVKAAKVLYRVLGISFEVEWRGPADATLFVDRCALAKDYSEITCLVLSATDEGVVKGLNPKMRMAFKNRITNGCSKCTADIKLKSQ